MGVAADVGVRVHLAGRAVGGPARVADAAAAGQGVAVVDLFRQVTELAGGLDDLGQFFAVAHGEAGGVIAAVLQVPESVQQNGRCLLRAGISHDAAHNL